MKSAKQDTQAFQVYSLLNHSNEEFFDTFFSTDLVDALNGKNRLFITRNSDNFDAEVQLDDVLYDENYTNDMNDLKYEFHFKVLFHNVSMFSISVSKIDHSPSESIYWLYSNHDSDDTYKFLFKK